MNLDGIRVRIAKVSLSNTRDVLGDVGHECQGMIVWRFVWQCACLQKDFLACALAQTLLVPWSKNRPRECATFGISKHDKTETTFTDRNSTSRRCTRDGNDIIQKICLRRAIESDEMLLRSIVSVRRWMSGNFRPA